MTGPSITQVLLALILVGISIGVSRWWQIPVAKDMALGSIRAFVQLVAVGYALEFIFDLESLWLISLAILIMILVGAQAASSRVKRLKGAFPVTFASMITGSLFTLAVMLILHIIPLQARYVIPLAGMIISNSMNASALSIDRLASDLRSNELAIETSLSLGKTWRVASSNFQRAAATTGMISMLNFMKTVGIVALPGAMTGMILAGAKPLEAVLLQVIVAYMLLSAVTITSVVAVELTVRKFFTSFHQLRREQ
jgi:putative ABC transport system permease protein